MKIEKAKLYSSPYIGVFSIVTETTALLPLQTESRTVKVFEKTLGVKVVKTSFSSSPLLGVFGSGNSKGIVVSGLVEKSEIKELEKNGLNVMKLKSILAIGNLMKMNDSHGVCSSLISKKDMRNIEKKLGIVMENQTIAKTDLVGSCMELTNKGFIVNPRISEKEFEKLEKNFKLRGVASTANYGDGFVGNSVVANSNGAIVGELTSGHELVRIDEGLRGE